MEAVDEERVLLFAQARLQAKEGALQRPQRLASFLLWKEWPARPWDPSFVPALAARLHLTQAPASNLRLPRPNLLLRRASQLAALIARGSAVAEQAGCDATACTQHLRQRRSDHLPQVPRAHLGSSLLRSPGLAEAARLLSP